MEKFKPFAKAINERITKLSEYDLFVVDTQGINLEELYLDSFPKGTDPIFKTNTEHNCNCCKSFIRQMGNVVAIVDGELQTIWDVEVEYPYSTVTKSMDSLVKSCAIESVFYSGHGNIGRESDIKLLESDSTIEFNHFNTVLARKFVKQSPDSYSGKSKTNFKVIKRALDEFTTEAIGTVLELINDNAIYRGEEFKNSVTRFSVLKAQYMTSPKKDLVIWQVIKEGYNSFRNSVIGTLIQDLSNGMPVEDAVRSYEVKVAPSNYKRTTALITKAQIERALVTVDELGLRKSLNRRFAVTEDVSINNVLFADRSVSPLMKDSLLDSLMKEAKGEAIPDSTDITTHEFMNQVLPSCTSLEVFAKNNQESNLVSITAPITNTKGIFKWNNNFGWSYKDNVTDSIKQRVKKAGGNVDAELRFSLSWFNSDDLDIHVYDPNDNHISFQHMMDKLDVDMNAGNNINSIDPVENVSWTEPDKGRYLIEINNYRRRNSANVGFELEIACNGTTTNYSYSKGLPNKETVKCLVLNYDGKSLANEYTNPDLVEGSQSKDMWNISTEKFVPVNMIMQSPNHWDENAVGNKHWFFILKDCINPEKTRGIYNEFLKQNLNVHRKVFEVLGDKTKCELSDNQLSGLGFSSTRKDEVIIRVDNQRTYNIKF